MKITTLARGMARLGTRALTLGVLLIPALFVAAVLVARGAWSVPAVDALYAAASSPDPRAMREAVERLSNLDVRDHCGYTPLGLMASYGRRDAVEMLLRRGAAVDVGHPLLGTPLMLALANGDADVARTLLEHGADVRVQCEGWDALASAVRANDLEFVELVLAAGADPRSTGRRYNLLTLAVQPNDVAVLRQLLDAGVDPNLPDADGNTPLIHAIECDATECARLLLAAGADLSRAGAGGHTPRSVARQRGCRATLELLASVEG